jgi:hypothetical protein
VNKNVQLGLVDSESMAMEALRFHESIKILDHERVVNGGNKLDMSVMTWTKV